MVGAIKLGACLKRLQAIKPRERFLKEMLVVAIPDLTLDPHAQLANLRQEEGLGVNVLDRGLEAEEIVRQLGFDRLHQRDEYIMPTLIHHKFVGERMRPDDH